MRRRLHIAGLLRTVGARFGCGKCPSCVRTCREIGVNQDIEGGENSSCHSVFPSSLQRVQPSPMPRRSGPAGEAATGIFLPDRCSPGGGTKPYMGSTGWDPFPDKTSISICTSRGAYIFYGEAETPEITTPAKSSSSERLLAFSDQAAASITPSLPHQA